MRMWQWKWNAGDNGNDGGEGGEGGGGVRARRERAAKHSGRFCCLLLVCWAAVLIVVGAADVVAVVGLVEN